MMEIDKEYFKILTQSGHDGVMVAVAHLKPFKVPGFNGIFSAQYKINAQRDNIKGKSAAKPLAHLSKGVKLIPFDLLIGI